MPRVTFDESEVVTSGGLDGIEVVFPFEVVRSREGPRRDEVTEHTIRVSISGSLLALWGYERWDRDPDQEDEITRLLFEYARETVMDKLASETLAADEEVDLHTNNTPSENPWDPEQLRNPGEAPITSEEIERRRSQGGGSNMGFQTP